MGVFPEWFIQTTREHRQKLENRFEPVGYKTGQPNLDLNKKLTERFYNVMETKYIEI